MLLEYFRIVKNFSLDLLFPKFCFGCQKENSYLCDDCENKILFFNYLNCPVCKLKTENGFICKNCRKKSKIDKLISAAHSDDLLIKSMIHQFKYSNAKSLCEILSQLLLKFLNKNKYLEITTDKIKDFIIVPVPLHWLRLRQRGYNQAELIAKKISLEFKIENYNALKRIKNNKPQVETENRSERIANVMEIFTIKNNKKIRGKIVLLVDDVATTRSTLNECAKVLKNAGAKQVWGITIARG